MNQATLRTEAQPQPSASSHPGELTVIYGKGAFASGQRLATELLVDGLIQRGWTVRVIATPLQDRTQSHAPWAARMQLLGRLLVAWLRGIVAAFGARPLYVNLGQTRFAMLRDGLPLLVRGARGKRDCAVISLHGNLFTHWHAASLEARLLRRLARPARYVTILGTRQRDALVALG